MPPSTFSSASSDRAITERPHRVEESPCNPPHRHSGIMGHVFLTFSANDVNQLTEHVDVMKMIESKELK